MAFLSNKVRIILILSALVALNLTFNVKVNAVDPVDSDNDNEDLASGDENRQRSGTNVVIEDQIARDNNPQGQNTDDRIVDDQTEQDGASSSRSRKRLKKDRRNYASDELPMETIVKKFELVDVQNECTICQESIPQDELKTTDCLHTYHENCLQTWMNAGRINSRRCPVCRTDMPDFRTTNTRVASQGIPINTYFLRNEAARSEFINHMRDFIENMQLFAHYSRQFDQMRREAEGSTQTPNQSQGDLVDVQQGQQFEVGESSSQQGVRESGFAFDRPFTDLQERASTRLSRPPFPEDTTGEMFESNSDAERARENQPRDNPPDGGQ